MVQSNAVPEQHHGSEWRRLQKQGEAELWLRALTASTHSDTHLAAEGTWSLRTAMLDP
jgi:hypothetical protein